MGVVGTVMAAGGDIVVNGGFDDVKDGTTIGWRDVGRRYVFRDGTGRNGTRGLCYENDDPKFYSFPGQKVPFKTGRAYEFEVWVKTENLQGDDSGATLCIEWSDKNGKWLGGTYPRGVKGTSGWTRVKGITGRIPENATTVRVNPYVRKGMTGKAWFDDLSVCEYVPPPVTGVYSTAYRNIASDGDVTFRVALDVSPDDGGELWFSYRDAKGDLRRVRAVNAPHDGVTLPVASMKAGRQDVVAEFFKGTNRIGSATCAFTRIERLPPRAVWFDKHGRTIADGKPFFPLGMYWGAITTNKIEKYAMGPFNCLMPYQPPKSPDLMDLCHEKGLKVIYSVKDIYHGTRWVPKGIASEEDEARFIKDRVSRFKNHPALLAWYLNDELPLSMLPRLTARRALMEELDPGHPGWTVLYQYTMIRDYMPSFDVVGTDPYPIPMKSAATATEWTRQTVSGTFGCKPVWQVPQAFNWAAYKKKPEEKGKYRAPTEAELRSMCWQCIANGANGLVLYSYFDLEKRPDGDDFDKRWAECCRVGAEIRAQFPVLLSSEGVGRRIVSNLDYEQPDEDWKGPTKPVSVRTWVKDGDTYILVVNGYEKTRRVRVGLSDGGYSAAASVFGPKPRLGRDAVELDLAPLEPALVRLVRGDSALERLGTQFSDPPDRAGVNCWWWWLNGNTDKAAISSELAAMKEKRFQGAMIFDAGGQNQRGNRDVPAGPLFGSKEWCDLFVFALDEAERLGLSIGFNIQSGWNLGGPCVTPQFAAKRVVCSRTVVEGGAAGVRLPQPKTRLGFYRDVAVIAFPLDDSAKASEPVNFLAAKLAAQELGGSATDCRFLLDNAVQDKSVRGKNAPYLIRRNAIVDLTRRMSRDGALDWTAPSGRWEVMRIGYTCTGAHVSTSSKRWQGYALDYLSREAFDFYWRMVVDPILSYAGRHVGRTLRFMETDSWECGGMNWTDGFESVFAREMGYDPVPYLAVLAGHVVDDMDSTTAFLADFRKCIAHMIARNHYGRFAELAHGRGMGIQPESAGPHAGPLDGILNYSYSDIVMSEFWAPSPHRPQPPNRFFVKQAASAAHIYGKRIVGAESFTTIGPHWNDLLWRSQKSSFDHEICSGLNRSYFHTFTTSPEKMGVPGQEYFAGTHVNPRVTWWNEAGAFIDYMRRVQFVVQEGHFVADVAYYYGDHVPNICPLKEADMPKVLPGFDYDVLGEDAFLTLSVDHAGRVALANGLSYRALVLPDHGVLSLAALRQVKRLLHDGATVVGVRPTRCVSNVGGTDAQREFRDTVAQLWGGKTGKGTLVAKKTARKHLIDSGVRPDFAVAGSDAATDLNYIHYRIGEADLYFVSSQVEMERAATCAFRVCGRRPELWDPLTGGRRMLDAFTQKDGVTEVPLRFDPYGAYFIVFAKPCPETQNGTAASNFPVFEPVQTLDGAWQVSFDPAWGGPGCAEFPRLIDWTQSADEGIKYYSGAAHYRKTFTLRKDRRECYSLQLGNVLDTGIASVRLNGVDLGIVWTKPFRVDATSALKDGENMLEVKVVNSWYNRVKGDQLYPGGNPYTRTNINLGGDKKHRNTGLSPSGLLGPVQILTVSPPPALRTGM